MLWRLSSEIETCDYVKYKHFFPVVMVILANSSTWAVLSGQAICRNGGRSEYSFERNSTAGNVSVSIQGKLVYHNKGKMGNMLLTM